VQVKFNDELRIILFQVDSGKDVCGCRHMEEIPDVIAVPEMTSYRDRFVTFSTWPQEIKSQTPRDMAKAGLFYTGEDDKTICFYCGGNIYRWEPQDDPWTEHARFYLTCRYLITSKGRGFVSSVKPTTVMNKDDLIDTTENLIREIMHNSTKLLKIAEEVKVHPHWL